jgi:hypothetical protein
VSSDENLSGSLPTQPGYTHLMGVPVDVVEQLRSLHAAALDGGMSLSAWRAAHAQALAGCPPDVDPARLDRLVARAEAAAAAALDDFDRWLFLAELQQNLQLLRVPDPGREVQQIQAGLPALTEQQTRSQAERHLQALQAMAGRTQPEPYEPGTRMIKALRVGTLEETNRWLQAAVARNPGASVQDLLTWAAVEVAQAKQELDRYDELKKARPDEQPTP